MRTDSRRDTRRGPRTLLARYGVALFFLLGVATGYVLTNIVLAPSRASAVRTWTSTSVTNLHHHPVPALFLSAFIPSGSGIAWLAIIAVAMFGANRAVGNAWLLLICASGHIVGTLVSEGIVAYRVAHGTLPAAALRLLDIGPSYVVVSAIVVAVLLGSWLARAMAVIVFAVLVFGGHIFAGLTSLNVAAVGHLVAMVTAALLCAVLIWRRQRQPVSAAPGPVTG